MKHCPKAEIKLTMNWKANQDKNEWAQMLKTFSSHFSPLQSESNPRVLTALTEQTTGFFCAHLSAKISAVRQKRAQTNSPWSQWCGRYLNLFKLISAAYREKKGRTLRENAARSPPRASRVASRAGENTHRRRASGSAFERNTWALGLRDKWTHCSHNTRTAAWVVGE